MVNTSKILEIIDFLRIQESFINANPLKFAKIVTKKCSEFFDVELAGVWFFSDDQTTLSSKIVFNADSKRFHSGESLKISDYPKYFEKILSKQCLVAIDTFMDDATSELVDVYMRPHNVHSILDTAITERGNIIGILCLEKKEVQRRWSRDEILAAEIFADFLSFCCCSAKNESLINSYQQSQLKLNELNKSMSVLISRMDDEIKTFKDNYTLNLKNNILPILHELASKSGGTFEVTKLVKLVEKFICEFETPLTTQITMQSVLSLQEYKVAQLVSEGLQSKDIASILSLSKMTVDTHKRNIRKKLAITNKEVNLKNYLKQLFKGQRLLSCGFIPTFCLSGLSFI